MRISKENLQVVKTRKKERTKKICIAALVLSIILLFLPPALRLFVEPPPPPQIDVIHFVSCAHGDETLSSTFLNNEPKNIKFIANGDVTVSTVADRSEYITPDEENSSDVVISGQLDNTSSTIVIDNSDQVTNQANGGQNIITDSNATTDPNAIEGNTDAGVIETSLITDINAYISYIREYSTFDYNAEENMTTIITEVPKLKGTQYYNELFSSVEKQYNMFSMIGFTCTTSETRMEPGKGA